MFITKKRHSAIVFNLELELADLRLKLNEARQKKFSLIDYFNGYEAGKSEGLKLAKIMHEQAKAKRPMFEKLESMPFDKLKEYAYSEYGIVWSSGHFPNKYDLIEEILGATNQDRINVMNRYKE